MTLDFVRVETFKYPNQIRYFYPSALIEETSEHLTTFMGAGVPYWNGKLNQLFRSDGHSLSVVFFNRDYNVSIGWDADWNFKHMYINVALPGQWDGRVCSYVDLDLDLIWFVPQSKRVLSGELTPALIELDRDEYEERKVALSYPAEIQQRTEQGLLDATEAIESGVFPFQIDYWLNWRPGPEALALAKLPDKAALWHLEKGL